MSTDVPVLLQRHMGHGVEPKAKARYRDACNAGAPRRRDRAVASLGARTGIQRAGVSSRSKRAAAAAAATFPFSEPFA